MLKNQFLSSIRPSIKQDTALSSRKPVRLLVDGVFDITHSGHFNALRRAKEMCDILVVGVTSEAEIQKYKGKPVLSQEERMELPKNCKWVDEVIPNVNYFITLEDIDKYNCQYLAHGDDLITIDGRVMYDDIRQAGRFKIFKRTEGISTTDMIGRMLNASHIVKRLTNEEKVLLPDFSTKGTSTKDLVEINEKNEQSIVNEMEKQNQLQFKMLNSTRRIIQFSNKRNPTSEDKIIYTAGGFDVLHKGHISLLNKAKELGSYLIVGIYDDETVQRARGEGFPICGVFERSLSVLAMRDVDEVIIGAPWTITKEMIVSLGCNQIVEGSQTSNKFQKLENFKEMSDPNELPKSEGLFQVIQSQSDFTMNTMIERLMMNSQVYNEVYKARSAKLQNYYKEKVKGNVVSANNKD